MMAPNERRWRLSHMTAELIQDSSNNQLIPFLGLLLDMELDLARGRKVGGKRADIVAGLYGWHYGQWVS